MTKEKSAVWNYYTEKITDNKSVWSCNYCNQSYNRHVTRMWKHLLQCKSCPQDIRQIFIKVEPTDDDDAKVKEEPIVRRTRRCTMKKENTCIIEVSPKKEHLKRPTLSGRPKSQRVKSMRKSNSSTLKDSILREQLLESRARRHLAEYECSLKKLELEKQQREIARELQEQQRELLRDEARWAHETRMMKLVEEKEEIKHNLRTNKRVGDSMEQSMG